MSENRMYCTECPLAGPNGECFCDVGPGKECRDGRKCSNCGCELMLGEAAHDDPYPICEPCDSGAENASLEAAETGAGMERLYDSEFHRTYDDDGNTR
jgi:hypothetical protein